MGTTREQLATHWGSENRKGGRLPPSVEAVCPARPLCAARDAFTIGAVFALEALALLLSHRPTPYAEDQACIDKTIHSFPPYEVGARCKAGGRTLSLASFSRISR